MTITIPLLYCTFVFNSVLLPLFTWLSLSVHFFTVRYFPPYLTHTQIIFYVEKAKYLVQSNLAAGLRLNFLREDFHVRNPPPTQIRGCLQLFFTVQDNRITVYRRLSLFIYINTLWPTRLLTTPLQRPVIGMEFLFIYSPFSFSFPFFSIFLFLFTLFLVYPSQFLPYVSQRARRRLAVLHPPPSQLGDVGMPCVIQQAETLFKIFSTKWEPNIVKPYQRSYKEHCFDFEDLCREGFLFLPCNNQPSPRVPKYTKRITIKS